MKHFYPFGLIFASKLLEKHQKEGLQLAGNGIASAALNLDSENSKGNELVSLCYILDICKYFSSISKLNEKEKEFDDSFIQKLFPKIMKILLETNDIRIRVICASIFSILTSLSKEIVENFWNNETEENKNKVIRLLTQL